MKPNRVVRVVSELATNAVVHAIGGYEVGLDASKTDVAVSARYAGFEQPQMRDAGTARSRRPTLTTATPLD